jgi:antitoxin ChpS
VSPAEPEKPKYTLAELLAECDPDAPVSEEEQEWQDSPPVAREEL